VESWGKGLVLETAAKHSEINSDQDPDQDPEETHGKRPSTVLAVCCIVVALQPSLPYLVHIWHSTRLQTINFV